MAKEYEYKKVNAELVSVTFDTALKKRDGGTYKGTELIYKAFNKVNEKGIHEKTFEIKPELRGQLQALGPKDPFTLHMYREKGSKFWNIDSVTPGHTNVRSSSQAQGSAPNGSSGFSETPNPAAVGQVLNLALELKLVKNLSELDDLSKAREVVLKIKKAKKNIETVWDTDPEPANEPRNTGPDTDEGFDDDIPF